MGKKRRKKRKPQNNLLVLKLLILVVIVLVLFEGKLIYTMFTQGGSSSVTVDTASLKQEETDTWETDADTPVSDSAANISDLGSAVADVPLAGLSALTAGRSSSDLPQKQTEDPYRISEEIDSPAVVKKQETSVDDSYFSDAVFIGDSRMEGFRNSSGITQGTFLTSVGLNSSGMSEASISSPDGTISVYQGLSGIQYGKIYLMLGTNDLGYYPWDDFTPNFENVIEQFHRLQSGAVIYICSVIYVDESKVSASYNNNENVRKINGYLLDICEEYDYCHYLNLNEIFTNGYGSLLETASSDGIHLYADYCKQMLDYLKSHYISAADTSAADTALDDEAVSETEAETDEIEIIDD